MTVVSGPVDVHAAVSPACRNHLPGALKDVDS